MADRPTRAPGGGPIAMAGMAAALIHMLALNGLSVLQLGEPAGKRTTPSTAAVSVRMLTSTPPAPTQAAPEPSSLEFAAQRAGNSAPAVAAGEGQVVYLPASDVDQVAKPRMDFVIRVDRLPRDTLLVAELTLWVSAHGRIVHWQVEHVDASAPWVQEVFSALSRTRMEPARLRGSAVASTLQIQIALDNRIL